MLNSLRTRIGNVILKRDAATFIRNRSMMNLTSAKSIGILYPLFAIPDYRQVESFVSELQHQHKEVKALGYVQYKEMGNRFLPKLSYDFFSQQQLNWYCKPVNNKVRDFIAQEYDLLIDLTIEENLPLKFVAGLSRARCKVGRFSEENEPYYDLMIKIDPVERLSGFISQVKHYLTIIKQHE
ncbi:MAG: hypothetical protein D4R67_04550 [Bacteroidetes bacterium]|nr:MAG: hypothetical protein D4R67_04550 [Bacteroidota bacterium]